MLEYGLRDNDKQVILDILKSYPQIEEAILFGSRALNTFKATSDVDFAIKGKDIHTILAALIADFEESDLIYEVDLVDYAGISTEKLLEHIDRHGKVFYRKGWIETTIGTLVNNKVICKPFDGNHGEKHPKGDDFVSEGVPFVMASDLKDGKVDLLHCNFITKKQANSLRKGFAKNDDVLLSHKATIGRTALLETSLDYVMLTPQVTYYRVKDKSKLSNVFLKHYFDSHFFQNTLLSYAGGGSTRLYIGITSQLDLPVILPPISEQKAIANILSSFDEKIELLREQNKTLETLAQTIFKEWFVNFNYPGATGEMVDSELGEIPKGWWVGSLLDVFDLIGGGTPKTSVDEYWNGGVSWYSVVDAPKGSDTFVINTEKNISALGLSMSSTKILQKGTSIVSARDTVGKLALVGCETAMNQSCYGIKGKSYFGDYYVYFQVKATLKNIKRNVHGAVFDTITQSTFRNIMVCLPSDYLVTCYEEAVSPMMDKILNNVLQVQSLSKTRDTILPKLMSGQVRTGEA